MLGAKGHQGGNSRSESSSEFCKRPPTRPAVSAGPPRLDAATPTFVGVYSVAIDSSWRFAMWHLHESHCSNRSARTQNTNLKPERENSPPLAGDASFRRGGPTETAGREGGALAKLTAHINAARPNAKREKGGACKAHCSFIRHPPCFSTASSARQRSRPAPWSPHHHHNTCASYHTLA